MFSWILWLSLIIVSNKLAGLYARQRAISKICYPYKPLPDIIHEYLPKIDVHTPDCLIFITIICISSNLYYMDTNILGDYAKVFLTTLSIRPIFVCLTTLPTCMHENSDEENLSFYQNLFLSSHDLMFVYVFGRYCWKRYVRLYNTIYITIQFSYG
jgi:hypothetical protein